MVGKEYHLWYGCKVVNSAYSEVDAPTILWGFERETVSTFV